MPATEKNLDVYQMLNESAKRKKEEKTKLLESLGVKEYFEEGSITINKRTCKGVECKLCVDACPTNALYWGYGEVKINEELCVYCAACVLSCIVDDCIRITRKRMGKGTECYGTPSEVFTLLSNLSNVKRLGAVSGRFPSPEKYLELLIKMAYKESDSMW
jgi:ferredoxin